MAGRKPSIVSGSVFPDKDEEPDRSKNNIQPTFIKRASLRFMLTG
jgi:hypothetical protein